MTALGGNGVARPPPLILVSKLSKWVVVGDKVLVLQEIIRCTLWQGGVKGWFVGVKGCQNRGYEFTLSPELDFPVWFLGSTPQKAL